MGDSMSVNASQNEALLRLEGICKRYPGGVEAVRSVSLDVRRGEVFGLVGPNGAGKSTLLKLIAGLLRPERGRVRVADHDVTGRPEEAARWIGLMPDPLGVYTDISCREYLQFFAKVHGLAGVKSAVQIEIAVEMLGLGPWMEAEVESLSAGWQRRLALGRMLLLDAPLLLLDEPAAGLDVRARAELLEIVRGLSGLGRTVVISSHILPELEELADRFGIMDQGRWVEVSPGRAFFDRTELKQGLGGCRWRLLCAEPAQARVALAAAGAAPIPIEGGVEFAARTDAEAAASLRAAVQAGVTVVDFRRLDTGLADVVLRVLEGGQP
jgi:ABC-2 type transport system ATP-binding protein